MTVGINAKDKTPNSYKLTDKQEQVYKVLLCPIVSDLSVSRSLYKNGDTVYSGQTYRTKSGQTADPDMSDFAVGFYKIVYKELLEELLDESGFLLNCSFAGDTMNSFNSIANITPGAGKSKKARTPEHLWSNELRDYKHQYHCLANFWLIPMCIGRTSMKLNHFDSMDVFLDSLKVDYATTLKTYRDYLDKINSFDSFIKTHFLDAYIPTKQIKYCEENAYRLIEQATDRIKQRAEDLAKSEYSDELWEYFDKHRVMQQNSILM